jgi:hypothetical protein
MEIACRGRGIAERNGREGLHLSYSCFDVTFAFTVQKARQCSGKEEGPQLNTFSVKRQPYQVVRRTRGTTWHLAE